MRPLAVGSRVGTYFDGSLRIGRITGLDSHLNGWFTVVFEDDPDMEYRMRPQELWVIAEVSHV